LPFLLFFCILICFFLGLLFCFTCFSHFFTNKLIFKFIGFWLSGEHNYNCSWPMAITLGKGIAVGSQVRIPGKVWNVAGKMLLFWTEALTGKRSIVAIKTLVFL
jgi:hypothetical protein